MRPRVRSVTVVGAISTIGLGSVWFAAAAQAQETHHGAHPSVPLPSQEMVTGIVHGATQGAAAFLAGLVTFAALVWLPATRAEAVEGEKVLALFCRWMWALFGLLVVAGLVEIPLYAIRASGNALSTGLLAEALFDTRVGSLWIARLGLGFLTAAAATYASRQRNPVYWWIAAVAATFMLLTLTLQSHAAAEDSSLPFAADWLHAAAASVWMGGLLGFPILLLGPLRSMPVEACRKLLGRAVLRFSTLATIAVASLLLTGLYAILLHVPSPSALLDTSYGRALCVKLGLLVLLLGYGAQNLRLRGREPFGLLVTFELVLAICIFVATGFLTTLPPADAEQPVVKEGQTTRIENLREPPLPEVRDDPAQPSEEAVVHVDAGARA